MKLNMDRIRTLIAGRTTVSIPWLQQELEIHYTRARELVEKLIQWGWLEDKPRGVEFAVRREYLEPRRLTRPEMEDLIPRISNDALRALGQIARRPGADVQWVEQGVHGEADTMTALALLEENGLIYRCGRRHYLRITPAAAALLVRIFEDKPVSPFASRHRDKVEAWLREVQKILDEAYQNAQSV